MKKIIFGLVMVITMIISIPVVDAASAHTSGTNVLGTDGTVYFLRGVDGLAPSMAKERVPYTSAGAFLSYKFNSWSKVVPANSSDMALPLAKVNAGTSLEKTEFIPPRDGSLINDKGTVYLITNYGGSRAGFASSDAFLSLGYSFSNVYPGDTSFLNTLPAINSAQQAHHPGTLVNDNGTLYVIANGGTEYGEKIGFTSMDIFNSWGYWLSDAVKANNYDRQLRVAANAYARGENHLNIPPLNFPPFNQ